MNSEIQYALALTDLEFEFRKEIHYKNFEYSINDNSVGVRRYDFNKGHTMEFLGHGRTPAGAVALILADIVNHTRLPAYINPEYIS